MSMPEFPGINPELTCNQALNMILASIAMEAHVKYKLKKFT